LKTYSDNLVCILDNVIRVLNFTPVNGFVLLVSFIDGTEQLIDFEPVLFGEMWGPLCDPALFCQVTIDPIAHTLSWPNGADFDPETLRNWPEYQEELAGVSRGTGRESPRMARNGVQ
jgi:hypothetical protein